MRIPGGLIAGAVVFALYLATLCPTVYVGDSGELITASALLGVAHPPGYPIYTLIGRLFTLLPFGSVALRVNLMSALFGAAAVGLVFSFVRSLIEKTGDHRDGRTAPIAASLAAAAIFAFSRLVWMESVKAEVYSMNLFWIALILFLAARGSRPALLCFLLGLAAANHQTALLMFPGLVYLLAADGRLHRRSILPAAAAFAAGLTPYLYLLVRPGSPELFAWRKPDDLAALVGHVTRYQYGSLSDLPRSVPLLAGQLWYLLRLLVREIGPAVLLVPAGLFFAWKKESTVWTRSLSVHFLLFSIGLLLMLNHGTGARDGAIAAVFYLPAVLFGVLVAAPVLGALARMLERVTPRLAFALVLLPLVSIFWNRSECDARRFTLAEEVGRATLDGTPKDAALLTAGDNNTFALYYLQMVEGKRPDVELLDRDLNLFPGRFAASPGDEVTHSRKEERIGRLVAEGKRPVCSVSRYTEETVAGKRLASAGPVYRFIDETREIVPSGIDRYHPGGFDPGALRGDYMARRFAVSYLSRWVDHYRETGDGEGMKEIGELLQAAGGGLPETHLVLGDGVAASGDTAAALVELEKSIEADPDFLIARREMADLLLNSGEVEQAVEEFALVADRSGMPGDRLNLANALLIAGDRDEAARAYRAAFEEADGKKIVLSGVAAGFEQLALAGDQARALEQLRAVDPGGFDEYEKLGDAWDRTGRSDRALEAYRSAARTDPGSAPVAYKLGLLLFRNAASGAAVIQLKRAIDIDPHFAGALNALAYIYSSSEDRLDEAMRLADDAVRYAGDDEEGYACDTRGMILQKLGRTDEAIDSYRTALEKAPAWDPGAVAETYDHLASALRERGEEAEALTYQARADSLRQAIR